MLALLPAGVRSNRPAGEGAPSVQAPTTGTDGAAAADAREADSREADSREAEVRAMEASLSVEDRVPLRIDRGEDQLALYVPRDEELVYEVHVAWGVIGTALGTVTMSTGVEPFRGSLLVPEKDPTDDQGKTAWMRAHAYGEHLFYTLDATLETRHQPVPWPKIVYRSSQGGSENRRRELLFGIKDGKPQSSYRRDTDKGAPRGTRIWKDPVYREIPGTALDMTSAVYLVRTFIARGLPEARFPVLDKKELWAMRVSRGAAAKQTTPAGRFDAIQVNLEARPYPGEPEAGKKFEGLFGLHGSIQLWVDRVTGVPVRVQGEIPAGPITLDVDIQLARFRGTPSGMRAEPVQRD